MAHGSDKTEKPTPRRLDEARKQGQVAKSQDLNSAVVLGSAILLMGFVGPYVFNNLHAMTVHLLSTMSKQAMTMQMFNDIYMSATRMVIFLVLPFFIGILVMGILSNVIQVKPLFTMKPLQPNFAKINPLQGFKRLWSMRSVVEVAKALVKMAIVGGVGTTIIMAHQGEFLMLGSAGVSGASVFLIDVIAEISVWTIAILFVMGLMDWWYQHYELEKQLMMTRQEIKDERKNLEGDPMIKSRIRQVGIQLARKRQLAAVPTADVIITNPTHFAIALKYDPDIAPAPRVVAKGQDHFAFKIREVAKEAGVPIVENKPLARMIYKVVEVDHLIPPELFVAVAEILAFVFSKHKGRRPKIKR